MEEEDEKKSQNNEGIISESDLLDLYDFQYNDLFSKILKINEEKFFGILQEQVILNLRIINKLSDLSLMSYFQEFIGERYKTEKKKITNDIEKLKKIPENEIVYLDYSNCYIHCHRNINAFHKCLNKLILYQGFIYCLHCNKVYNENHIKLYCIECEEVYFSKIRKNFQETNELFFPVVFAKNHCQTEYDEEEKIRCLECGEDLYFDLSKVKDEKYKYKKQSDFIKEIICTNCKLIYDTREIKFTCSECESDFMSDAKLYNDFPIYKKKILYLIHTLRKNKLAFPENYNGKKCKCDINLIKEFLHDEDNGILLQGFKDEKNKIVCEQCYEIFDGEKFEWKCPSCGDNFRSIKPTENNVIKTRSRSRSNKYVRAELRNEIKDEKKDINIKDDNKAEAKDIKEERKDNKIEIKNEIKNYKIDIKRDVKNEENENKNYININKKEEKFEKIYNERERAHHSSLDKNRVIKNENIIEEKKSDNNLNVKNEESNYKNKNNINSNQNNINITNYYSNNNKYNNRTDKINNNYRNYNQSNNENGINKYNNRKNNYRKLNTQIKHEENKNNRDRDVKEIYKNVSTKVIVETRSNISSNNSISNKRNINTQKRNNMINNRNKNKHSIYNIRHNHQIININETSKRSNQNRNSAFIEKNKKDIANASNRENKENIENKEIIEKGKENNVEEFNNLKKYFEDFNEEYEKDMENKNKKIKLKKEKKERQGISNKNLHIQINVDNNNKKHIKNNVSNLDNINNVHNIYHISNKVVNDTKNKNYQNTDNNNNIISQNNKRKPNGSRENIKDKKDLKNNLSSNKITRRNEASQNNTRRRKPYNVNIKINNYNKENKENNDINNNYNNRQKQNLQINIDKNKNEQKVIYNKYDTNNNKKEEEQIINEIKPEPEDKNDINDINIKQEPEIKIEKNNTYTQITINSNNYKNIKVLGQGSYGKIYLVEDIKTHNQFAMKKLILGDKLELRDNQDEYNMIMQITSTYPELNIIQVYGTETKNFDEYNFVFYVLMEVANCDWEKELLNRFRHQAFYTEEEIFYILQSLVDTFAYLQQIGICHRDIKPQNILCFGEKGYKISDFGEAKYRKKWRLQQSSVNYTSMQTVRGTELYMSPILYTALKSCPNKGATHNVFKSDVFSLGMCFLFASCLDYKCLYEVRKVNSMNKLQELVEKCVDGKYSQSFIDILLNMLQINEKERPDFIELSSMI